MERMLKKHGLDRFRPRWMTSHDKEEILAGYEDGQWGDTRLIAPGSVSLTLKHLATYREVLREPDRWHLILEDDVIIRPKFVEELMHCIRELPSAWDLLFVGLGCNLHVPWWVRRDTRRVYRRGYKQGWLWGGGGCSRCTEAYLIHPEFAGEFLASDFAKPPFNEPIDWHLNSAGKALGAESYWAEPPLVTQGAF